MDHLIDDLLQLSRLTRTDLKPQLVDLSILAREVTTGLQKTEPNRRAEFHITPGLTADGDERLIRILLENLLNNAWKFTRNRDFTRIEFGMEIQSGVPDYFVRDNGVGFNMAHAGKLFEAFHRLHNASDFPGHGIGLATVQRIVNRHQGHVRARSEIGQGASFHFTLAPERDAS
jgi:signal transduction histidine kinase